MVLDCQMLFWPLLECMCVCRRLGCVPWLFLPPTGRHTSCYVWGQHDTVGLPCTLSAVLHGIGIACCAQQSCCPHSSIWSAWRCAGKWVEHSSCHKPTQALLGGFDRSRDTAGCIHSTARHGVVLWLPQAVHVLLLQQQVLQNTLLCVYLGALGHRARVCILVSPGAMCIAQQLLAYFVCVLSSGRG